MAEGQELLLRKDLERVVDRLHQERTHVAPYQEDYRRLLDNHGKMIRAAMVVLFARAGARNGGCLGDTVITGAAAIEMLHLATLVHDDVLDNAPIRRNKPTVHTIRGNKAAIYLGDLIRVVMLTHTSSLLHPVSLLGRSAHPHYEWDYEWYSAAASSQHGDGLMSAWPQ